MLSWTLTFLAVALLSGLLGFSGGAELAAGIAKAFSGIFMALFLVSWLRGRRHV